MKTLKQCTVEGCKRTGETQRSYYLCPEHWVMMKLYDSFGDTTAKNLLRHAGHGLLNEYWRQCLKEIESLTPTN